MPDDPYPDQARRPKTGVSIGLFFNDEVLLVKRGKEPFVDHWAFPGGSQEWGETLEEAARRELLEETAIECAELSFCFIHEPIVRDGDAVAAHFVLAVYCGELSKRREPISGDDAKDAGWFPISDVGQLRTTPAFSDRLSELLALRNHG